MADVPVQSGSDSSTASLTVETEAAFERLLTAEDTVLVDFYADWCGPCRMMASTVEELATEKETAVVKVNVEDLPPVAAKYDVQSIPAFLVFRESEVTDRLVGMQEKEDLRGLIR